MYDSNQDPYLMLSTGFKLDPLLKQARIQGGASGHLHPLAIPGSAGAPPALPAALVALRDQERPNKSTEKCYVTNPRGAILPPPPALDLTLI